MIEVEQGLIRVPSALQQWVRDSVALAHPRDRPLIGLTQLGDDVWAVEANVSTHQDGTARDLVTYGCVLVNDPCYLLEYRRYESGPERWDLSVGTLFKMDARLPHATWPPGVGMFAALIWDSPPTWSLRDFRDELMKDERFQG